LGDRDSAIESLERAYADRSTNIAFLEYDPTFDGLRSDVRFAALAKRIAVRKRKAL
jgi:hypothetical protein